MDSITTGDWNTALGYNAGTALTSGMMNVMIGNNAGSSLSTTNSNVAIGNNAGVQIVGTGNVAIGNQAMYYSGSGFAQNYNVAIGYDAAKHGAKSAQRVIAIGTFAYEGDSSNSTGANDSVAVGYSALKNIETGDYNVAVGNFTLDALTEGEKNVAIGHNSGTGLTTGSNNIAIGYAALDAATTESHNIGIGYAALGGASLSGGINNMALGSYTLDGLTSGDNNLAVGYDAGGSVSTGSHNTTLGYQSGRLIQAGDKNITLGWTAGDNLTSGSNNVMIGGADAASATGSDQLSISSGDGSPVWITGTSAGVVSIGDSGSGTMVASFGDSNLFTSDASTSDGYQLAMGQSKQHSNSAVINLGQIGTSANRFAKLAATLGCFEVLVHVLDTSTEPESIQTEKMLVQQRDGTVDYTTYGQIYSGSSAPVTFSAVWDGGNSKVDLKVTGATAQTTAQIHYHITALEGFL
jgi:hypothetical protein